MILSIIVAFFSLIGLMVIHEFGHFIVAKKIGIKVEEFGIGYPPRLFGKKLGQTIYSLNLLPFGAFVRILGEGGEKSNLEDYQRFIQKPIWQRALVMLGGVVSFWIVAIILLSIIAGIGSPQVISDDEQGMMSNPKVQLVAISADSPASTAGLTAGDVILKISPIVNGIQFPITKVKEVQELSFKYKGQEITLTVQRGKEVFDVSLVPRVSPPEGEGALGVALARTAEKSYPWWQAPVKGVEMTANLTYSVVFSWGKIINGFLHGQGLPKEVQFVGPVGIGVMITQAAQVGIKYFLQFVAIISIYLALSNLLPIPAIDGGKLLFLIIEKIKGKPVNRKIEERVTAVFFGVLILLMIFVSVKDIVKLI